MCLQHSKGGQYDAVLLHALPVAVASPFVPCESANEHSERGVSWREVAAPLCVRQAGPPCAATVGPTQTLTCMPKPGYEPVVVAALKEWR